MRLSVNETTMLREIMAAGETTLQEMSRYDNPIMLSLGLDMLDKFLKFGLIEIVASPEPVARFRLTSDGTAAARGCLAETRERMDAVKDDSQVSRSR